MATGKDVVVMDGTTHFGQCNRLGFFSLVAALALSIAALKHFFAKRSMDCGARMDWTSRSLREQEKRSPMNMCFGTFRAQRAPQSFSAVASVETVMWRSSSRHFLPWRGQSEG